MQTINTTHSNNIIHVKELSSNKLVSCSLDTQLNFYSLQNLVVCGNNYLYVVDLVQFKLLNKINTGSNNISLCFWNDRLFVGTSNGMIQEYKVDGMNLSKISFKEKCHQNYIWQILIDEEGNLISCSHDNYIKIWN